MKNTKGFTLTELIVSFSLTMIVMIYFLKAIIVIVDRENELLQIQEYMVFESSLLNNIYTDISKVDPNTVSIDEYNNKIIITGIDKQIEFDTTNNYIIYDETIYALPEGVKFDNKIYSVLKMDDFKGVSENNSYYVAKINLLVNNNKKNIKIIHQTIDNSMEVLLLDNNNQYKNKVYNSSTTFDLSNIDLSNYSNISCNNGATINLENNILSINNITTDTICNINKNLSSISNNLDNTINNILIINDETETLDIEFKNNTNVVLDLNGKTITLDGKNFKTYSNLTINDTKNTGKIINTSSVLKNSSDGVLTINNGYFETINSNSSTIQNEGNGKIIINSGMFVNSLNGYTIQNNLSTDQHNGNIIINGGTFTSNNNDTLMNNIGEVTITSGTFISANSNVINNGVNGIININVNDNNKVYIMSSAVVLNPSITNSGVININAKNADKCTINESDTKQGLCVYAQGNQEWEKDSSNIAIENTGENSIININGGTYFGGYCAISNNYKGIIYVMLI